MPARLDPLYALPSDAKSPDDALASIHARIASKKRKREEAKESEISERSVRFSDIVEEHIISNVDPQQTSKEIARPPKTKAKQRYLKIKQKRYKASIKAKATDGEADGGNEDPSLPPPRLGNEHPDEEDIDEARRLRIERKARLKAERRLRKDNATADLDNLSNPTQAASGSTETPEPDGLQGSAQRSEESVAATVGIDQERADLSNDEAVDSAGLQPFPRPKRLSEADPTLLRELGVSEQLREGVYIDSSLTIRADALCGEGSQRPLISEMLRQRLAGADITSFFAVQAAVLPLLLEQPQLYPDVPQPDLCVSAPTGSGKTLAYVLPIIELLSNRAVTRLRALVVLPTRDLAQQVKEVFDTFCKGTDLRIGLATGQTSLSKEQQTLVGNPDEQFAGGHSRVDIVVATPGRLLEHLRSTPGFTLQHLRFLVIDEADRLVGQSFGEWLPAVLLKLEDCTHPEGHGSPVAPHLLNSFFPAPSTWLDRHRHPCVQKLLFSATLSRDPTHIMGLRLSRPIYIAVGDAAGTDVGSEGAFAIPKTLKEYMITSSANTKPLSLFHLINRKPLGRALCFTKSVEAAARLVELINLFQAELCKAEPDSAAVSAAGITGELSLKKRQNLLDGFRRGTFDLLVCSDLVARGLDIPDVVRVISYDVPVDMRKYVHRVGRTARAGRAGEAWTLVEKQEVSHFQRMLRKAGRGDKVIIERIKKAELQKMEPAYNAALSKLQHAFSKSR